MKKSLLFCTGLSGSGKSYFIKNIIPNGLFYSLKSATTRAQRENERDGIDYYFRNQNYFEFEKFATMLWVNEAFWKPGDSKWLYGVPEFEIMENIGKNMIYDVIQPKYVRQMIDWFKARGLNKAYDFRLAYFIPPENNFEIATNRANMPNDNGVRTTNTCDPIDFLRARLHPDWFVKNSVDEQMFDLRMQKYISRLEKMK